MVGDTLPVGWKWVTVDDVKKPNSKSIVSGPFGSNIGSRFFVASGVPVIRGNNLTTDMRRFVDDGFVFITEEKAEELKNCEAFPNDLIFTAAGTLGQVGIIPQDAKYPRYIISNKQMRTRLDENVVLPLFAFYWLSSFEMIEYIKQRNTGSSVPLINLTVLRELPLPLPPTDDQKEIVRILGALDDKIELNRHMNHTLESMAQALFRQWFINGEEVWSWGELPLPEIVEVNPSRLLKKGDIAPYLDMANMPTQGHRGIQWIDRPFGSGAKFINGDTLLARITPCLENGKTAYVDFLRDGQVGWGSTEYIVFRPKPQLPPEYAYYLARSDDLRNHAIQNMVGTSGRQRTPASCFDGYMVVEPPIKLAQSFGKFAKSIIDKVRANDEQSRMLASIRDSLLPKLLSGEIRTKQLDKEGAQ